MKRLGSFLVLGLLFSAVPALAVELRVRAADSNWVNTGIRITRGTRLMVTATGTVNVGPAGTFGPEGTTGPVPRTDPPVLFPADTPAFSLAVRLTTSNFAHDELRQDYTASALRDFCSPYHDGYVWLLVNDNQRADNSGEFVVNIETASCTAPVIPAPARTVVRVSEDGRPVAGAEVLLNGRLVRTTDARGEAVFPPLARGTSVIARRLVTEVPTSRGNHAQGSTRNWRYRAYLTSAAVADDGSLGTHTVTDPAAVQELTIRSNNTLIGLHLTAALEWDGAPFELSAIGNEIRMASQRLYNATDGQFFVEQTDIIDNASQWNDADYRIFANQSLRAHADAGGFAGSGFMWMNRFNWEYVYAHEFGHYGMEIYDEYADNSDISCTLAVRPGMSTEPFNRSDPRASCIMWNVAPKFCSMHPSNPHVTNTSQGPQDCHSRIARIFRDTLSFPRWQFRSPASRANIPGTLPPIPEAWQTRITTRNVRDGELCPSTRFVPVMRGTTTPAPNVDVYLRTHEGRTIYLGQTPMDNPDTPANETADGVIVVGSGPGDRILAGDATVVVPFCAIDVSASMAGGATRVASLAPLPLAQTSSAKIETRFVEVGAEPAAVSVEPRAKERATVTIRFREPVGYASATFTEVGSAKPVAIELKGAGRFWKGDLPPLAANVTGDLVYEGKGESGKLLEGAERVRIVPVGSVDRMVEIRSDDGQISLALPPRSLPKDAQVAINRIAVDGVGNLAAGPYSIAASHKLRAPATLRFHLPDLVGRKSGWSGAEPFDPQSFLIVRLDGDRWTPVETFPRVDVAVFSATVSELGTYALTARPKGKSGTLPPPPPPASGITATLSANPANATGQCPVVITFDGTITSDRAGEVAYTFLRSDGARGPVHTLSFNGHGTQKVSTTWTLGGKGLPAYSGWQAIRILKPVELQSNQAAFTMSCQ